MANATNATDALNASAGGLLQQAGTVGSAVGDFVPLVFSRLWDLLAAPFRHTEMLWIIFPLLLTFVVLEFYFDRHGNEELGWAAAVANSLILLIVAIDLLKHSFHYQTPGVVFKTIVLAAFTDAVLPIEPQVLLLVLFLAALGMAITIVNYYHLLPKRIAFEVSGHPPVNFLAYFAIAIVYSAGTEHPIPFDIPTLVAGALLFVLILLAVFIVRRSFRNLVAGTGRSSGW